MTAQQHTCDWCGAGMRQIADHGSGMARDHYALWLCNNPTCGHEQEHMKPRTAEQLLRFRGFK